MKFKNSTPEMVSRYEYQKAKLSNNGSIDAEMAGIAKCSKNIKATK